MVADKRIAKVRSGFIFPRSGLPVAHCSLVATQFEAPHVPMPLVADRGAAEHYGRVASIDRRWRRARGEVLENSQISRFSSWYRPCSSLLPRSTFPRCFSPRPRRAQLNRSGSAGLGACEPLRQPCFPAGSSLCPAAVTSFAHGFQPAFRKRACHDVPDQRPQGMSPV